MAARALAANNPPSVTLLTPDREPYVMYKYADVLHLTMELIDALRTFPEHGQLTNYILTRDSLYGKP